MCRTLHLRRVIDNREVRAELIEEINALGANTPHVVDSTIREGRERIGAYNIVKDSQHDFSTAHLATFAVHIFDTGSPEAFEKVIRWKSPQSAVSDFAEDSRRSNG